MTARDWPHLPLKERLQVIRRFRHLMAAAAGPVAAEMARATVRPIEEILTSEILPLMDAARFLEQEAVRILAPRRLGRRGRPLWLFGSRAEVQCVPYGTVLILGPGNYPLFLPGAQALQALAAGNVVRLKPAEGCAEPLMLLARLLQAAGLPDHALQVLGDSIADAERAIDDRPDKVVMTGSQASGRAVLKRLADATIPATMELSGNDAAFVMPGADLDLAVRALFFGLRLNGGATCIAPRRVFCTRDLAPALINRIAAGLPSLPPVRLSPDRRAGIEALLEEARDAGAVVVGRVTPDAAFRPVLVTGAEPTMALMQADVFAPVLSVVAVRTIDDALEAATLCPYALGASVFGRMADAKRLAGRIRTGVVTINDVIVPTADPRLPFGGRGASGFGTTRGREGLLSMTMPKVVIARCGRFRPHYDAPRPGDATLYETFIAAAHATGRCRWQALMRLPFLLRRRSGTTTGDANGRPRGRPSTTESRP